MNSADLKPNHRILIVDDNTSIHADFRKILCAESSRKAAVKKMSAALFDKAEPVSTQTGFELDSAYQGQEALEMVKKSLAENRPSYNISLYLEELRDDFDNKFTELRPRALPTPPAAWQPRPARRPLA